MPGANELSKLPAPNEIVILSGNSHLDLAHKIAAGLGTKVGKSKVLHFANKESAIDVDESIRSRNVYLVQSGSTKDVNNSIMELLIMAYCCKTSAARNVVAVVPYFPYSKQSKMTKRGCIVSKLLARMMVNAGVNHLVTMDLHQKEIQGFFDIPVDNLRASPFLLQYIKQNIPNYKNSVIVARVPAQTQKASSFAEKLGIGMAVIHSKSADEEVQDGRYSPPLEATRRVSECFDGNIPATSVSTVVGDVTGRNAIMVEDLIDDIEAFVNAAAFLKCYSVQKIYVLATHGVLSSDVELLEESAIDEVIVTNTVPHDHEMAKMASKKIKTIDVSVLLSEAIRRIHNKESMSYLFRNVALND
ncbi:phosphoribosyl pyrophosphate synthase-associated protein 2-like [Varroa jacobsoni]|nr:phosphoribosyl pyrophosphate synthase-associated protein 2-like isoform X2 [Varroa destructor]XP_022647008.1 phosphoribosyl pyrophosphate synthase-associated protein 2-like isoform X2 [Varroa destructor]XP_022647009.1 phosphoribosyl pyrophosphate synthase-associated protein 2-like isoform X2 [Varroa destructor]XP_022709647.1 phosphoribosyl pyrophosphate synthase-associated protein 2-like [Varroa jacobsoni]XP_022709648.1 phosphoribosyl pyrophosphate synthase-associated protein 2-like [Varroa 